MSTKVVAGVKVFLAKITESTKDAVCVGYQGAPLWFDR